MRILVLLLIFAAGSLAYAQDADQAADAAQKKLLAAQGLFGRGMFKLASQEYADFLSEFPTHPQRAAAMYALAICQYRQNDFESAATLLAGVLKDRTFAQRGDALAVLGHCELIAKHYEKAVAAFDSLLSEFPKSPHAPAATINRGQALFVLARHEEAAKACQNYLDAYPKGTERATALYFLALAQRALGQNDQMVAAANRLAKEFPDSRYLFDVTLLAAQGTDAAGGKPDAAIEKYRRALEIAPAERKSEAQYRLGAALYKAGKYDQAAVALAAVGEGPYAGPARLQLGLAQLEAGQIDNAHKTLAGATQGEPAELAAARYGLARCLIAEKSYDDARRILNELLAQKPAPDLAARALYLLGRVDFEDKQYDRAAQTWKDFAQRYAAHPLAAEASSARAAALYDLAWAQRNEKNNDQAIDTYGRLLKEHPDAKFAGPARVELAEMLYEQKKYPESAALLETVVADTSLDPKLLATATYRLGWCYQKQGQPDKAALTFSKFDPKQGGPELGASALLQAAMAYLEKRNFEAAEKPLAKMIEEYPADAQVRLATLRLGEVRAELGRYDESEKSYAAFIEKFPKDPLICRAHFGIGWSLENRQKYEEARAAYKRAIAADNGETAARAQFQIGETYLAEGKFEQGAAALLAVEDVYAYPKWSARALFEAGRAFEQLKQADRAQKQYEQVLEKYKDAPEASLAGARLKSTGGK
jgi:TolA-binding protein